MGFSFPKLWDVPNNTDSNSNTTSSTNSNDSSSKTNGQRFRIVRNGKVYDVTNFVDKHPGGRDVLEAHNGEDVTHLMESKDSHVHSMTAFSILDRYYIGTIESLSGKESSHQLAPPREMDYYKNDIVDWTKPILHQLPGLKERYFDWTHEPVDRSLRLFHSDFVEYFSKAPWYVVPIIWLPLCLYMVWVAFFQLVVVSSPAHHIGVNTFHYSGLLALPILFTSGILFWTLLEYVIHRWMFHLRPPSDSPTLILLHFILHGQHHKSPMDSERLVFPPVPASLFAILFYSLCVGMFPKGQAEAIFAGIIFGYLMYDMTHYYVHHGKPLLGYFRRLKSYHALHHYEHQELGFGISSKLWDYPFQTLIPEEERYKKAS